MTELLDLVKHVTVLKTDEGQRHVRFWAFTAAFGPARQFHLDACHK